MKETLESKVSKAKTLFDVLMVMKEKTMLDIHVATLAYYQEIISEYDESKGYAIIRVNPFPLVNDQNQYSIQAYCFRDLTNYGEFDSNEIMLVIYCDANFIQNLQSLDRKPKNTNDPLLHSLKYGIAIPLKK